MKLTKEQGLRYFAQGAVVLLVLVAAWAGLLYVTIGELETAVSQAQAETQKAVQEGMAARRKLQDDLNAATARAAGMEARLRQAESLKALLAKVEPQVSPVLEAAAKAGKPETRSAVLAGEGLIGQIVYGTNHDASLGVLVRALALDKSNCAAALGINLLGTKTVEVPADCEGVLPAVKPAVAPAAPAAAAPATPAAPAAPPSAAAAPAAAPAAPAPSAPASAPAGKSAEPAKAAPAGKN